MGRQVFYSRVLNNFAREWNLVKFPFISSSWLNCLIINKFDLTQWHTIFTVPLFVYPSLLNNIKFTKQARDFALWSAPSADPILPKNKETWWTPFYLQSGLRAEIIGFLQKCQNQKIFHWDLTRRPIKGHRWPMTLFIPGSCWLGNVHW